MSTRDKTVVAASFYVGLLAVLIGVLLQAWAEVLPSGLAAQIGHNSEAYLGVLVLAAWIQYARPRLRGGQREWQVTGAVAVACLVTGIVFFASDWPSRFRTLNETFLALAVLVPYVQLSRRPSRRVAGSIALGILIVVVVGQDTKFGVDLAETLGMVMLAPLAFDVVDRGILDPTARTSRPGRVGWYVGLALAPIALSVLQYDVGVGGVFGEFTRYGVRIHEAFIAMLLLEIYFAALLGRTGARNWTAPQPEPAVANR